MAKTLSLLIIHCTATPAGREVTGDEIRRWHTSPKAQGGRGWDRVGYARLYHLDGTKTDFIKDNEDQVVDNWEMTYGALGVNEISRHWVYAGGGTGQDTRTESQKNIMASDLLAFVKKHPQVKVAGHKQVNATSCPGFDAPAWCRSIGVPEVNIYKK